MADRGDVGGIQRIRAAAKENRLISRVLSEGDYVQTIERDGRGFYESAGWRVMLRAANGELRYELTRTDSTVPGCELDV